MNSVLQHTKLDIEKILAEYSVRNVKRRGDQIQFSCPFPTHARGDRHPSASFNTTELIWHCFSCKKSGSIVSFVAELDGTSYAQAKKKLLRDLDEIPSLQEEFQKMLERSAKKVEVKAPTKLPEEIVETFYVDWEKAYAAYQDGHLPKRLAHPFKKYGITPHTLREYGIGFDPHSKRISIPIRDYQGNLVGFKGRATHPLDEPKYLSLGDKGGSILYGFPTYQKGDYVFGLNNAGVNLIVVEGEFDAISLRQRGFPGAVSIGGSSPSTTQIRLIKKVCQRVTLLLDPDKAGKKATGMLINDLVEWIPVEVAVLTKNDPAASSTQEITDALEQAESPLKTKIRRISNA